MAVLLDDFEKANALLDGENSTASKFGAIRYYEDQDICNWVPELTAEEDLWNPMPGWYYLDESASIFRRCDTDSHGGN